MNATQQDLEADVANARWRIRRWRERQDEAVRQIEVAEAEEKRALQALAARQK